MKNSPAYPTFGETPSHHQGLSKRELLSAMVLQGLVGGKYSWPAADDISYLVGMSIKAADKLIKELEKNETKS